MPNSIPLREEGLKPCPFCGGAPLQSYIKSTGEYLVECDTDDCDMRVLAAAETQREANERWNRRALTPAPPDTAVIERLMHDGFKHGKTVREIAESIAAAELLRFVEGQ